MDERDRRMVTDFKSRLPEEVKSRVSKVLVYGSRAIGVAAEDSDLDVAILVDRKTVGLERQIDDVAYQVMWENDFRPILSVKVFEESRFRKALREGFSFYKAIEREGIPL